MEEKLRQKYIFCKNCNEGDLCYIYCKKIRAKLNLMVLDKINKKKHLYYYYVSNGLTNTRIKGYSKYKIINFEGKYIHVITNIKDLESISQDVIKDLLTDFSTLN